MRGKPTYQAQRAIDALKAAGYARSEFSVRTKWEHSMQGYGHAQIHVKASAERQKELAIEVAKQGVQVVFLMKDGKLTWPLYYEHKSPGIIVVDVDRVDKWGCHIRIKNLYHGGTYDG